MKLITKKLRNELLKGQDYARAIAFSILVKQMTVSSTVKGYTINKLHEMTGIHANTIQKHLLTLARLNLIDEQPNGCIVFKSLSSKTASRNMPPLDFDRFHTLHDIEYALYTVVIMDIIQQKEYVKEKLDIRYDPEKNDNFENARKFCRRYHYTRPYQENGLSYEGFAAKAHISKGKAEAIIKFAVKHHFIEKHNRQIQIPVWGIGKDVVNKTAFLETIGATFCTNNNVYKIYANTYTIISPELHKYEVDVTDNQINLPKWQTAQNLLDDKLTENQNEKKETVKKSPSKTAKAKKTEIPAIQEHENWDKNTGNRFFSDNNTSPSLVHLLSTPSGQEAYDRHGNISS